MTEAELIDRAEIDDLLIRYCQAQDQDEWSLYEGIFTQDAVIHFPGMGMESRNARDFGRFLEEFNKTRLSGQHLMGNSLIRIEGDRAHVVSEVIYITLHPTGTPGTLRRISGNALYSDDLVRTVEGWRIARRAIAQKNVEIDERAYDPALIAAFAQTSTTRWFAQDVQA